uniref:Uncharacterized protein n=1 Tax=Megaselia scalaris TaxID=36166 RepID=T1GQE3_MEGSC
MEILGNRHQERKFYQKVNMRHPPASSSCKDKNGNLITHQQRYCIFLGAILKKLAVRQSITHY